jgi:hypothetical protein
MAHQLIGDTPIVNFQHKQHFNKTMCTLHNKTGSPITFQSNPNLEMRVCCKVEKYIYVHVCMKVAQRRLLACHLFLIFCVSASNQSKATEQILIKF